MRALEPDFPFRPNQFPFFYGWLILVVATLAVLMSIPGQTMGVSVFTEPLMEVTGLSRIGLSNAYLCGTLLSGALLPWAGSLLDRVGARAATLMASAGLSVTLMYLSAVDRVADAVIGIVGAGYAQGAFFGAMVFGFFALRFTGQGMLTLIGRTLIGRWFDRLRGIVSGASSPFVSLGFSMTPILFAGWIDASGWRGAWLEMALVIGLGMGSLGWLVFRDSPEECGLRMDGAPEPAADRLPGSSEVSSLHPELPGSADREPEFDRSQAVRTLMFWAIVVPLALQGLTVTGITFHILDLGAEAGLGRTATIGIFPPIAVVSVLTSIGIGWLTNHLRIQTLFAWMLVAQVVGFASAAGLDDAGLYWATVAGLGFSGGCFVPLSTVAIPRFFGRQHLGAINSAMMMCIVWGSAAGPTAMAASRDILGSYQIGLYVCAAASALVLFPVLWAPLPPAPREVRKAGD
ncbi:MAG: MFS transporter [Candidatus Binatia bacterium]|nr:MFS transporter [Candidatus Binatia bacterium]MDG1959082.1 MFS transporter [Candidatus Binatia bacterium]MDG2010936.1 MFS transporter [Candidatus Binatia bacterium]HAC79489.1 MFS transporter [Deltaproteobacteria bacterium]